MEAIISSSLKPEEFLVKVQEQADRETLFGFFGSRPFLIRLKGLKFQLRKRIYYGNSFLPIFYGKVQASPEGCEVQGEFHMQLGVRIFMTFWFAGVGLAVLGVICTVIRMGLPEQHP